MVHRSSCTYLSSSLYHQPLPQSKKSSKICRERPPGPIIDDLERRYGPNPSDRSFGTSLGAHKPATGDKVVSRWIGPILFYSTWANQIPLYL